MHVKLSNMQMVAQDQAPIPFKPRLDNWSAKFTLAKSSPSELYNKGNMLEMLSIYVDMGVIYAIM